MYRSPATPSRARLPLLDQVTVKTPCRESWDAMTGDDRVRFCARCSKNVYDLTAMTQDEAEAFLAVHLDDENPCIRLYRRPDGRVLTSECVQGARNRHARKVAAGVTAGLCAIAASSVALANVHVPSGRNIPRSHARVDVKRLQPLTFNSDNRFAQNEDPPAPPAYDAQQISMGEASFESITPFPPSPTIKELGADVSAGLPEQVVRRVVRQNYGRSRLCYENRLAQKPGIHGKVAVKFLIRADGGVAAALDAGSDIDDAKTVACIVRGFSSLSFPKPDPEGTVLVTYRFELEPRPR